MVIATAGGIQDTITITPEVNYTTVEAKYQLKLRADGLASVPLFSDVPGTLQYEITLGTGVGERPAYGRSVIGNVSKPWEHDADNHKQYEDVATSD